MKHMTSRQRIMAALRNQETDRMPWAPLIDDYFISSLRNGSRPDAEILSIMEELGVDIIERHVSCVSEALDGVEVRHWSAPSGEERFREYTTPVGNLQCSWRHLGNSWVMAKHLVNNIEEAKIYQYIAEHTYFKPDFAAFSQRDALIGDRGIATASGPMSPVQELLQFMCGVENTVFLLLDYEEEMCALMAAMQERNMRQYKIFAESPVDVVIDYEDTSTTVMSRDMFNDHSLPFFNAYADIIQGAGKTFITHMCGSLNGFKQDIANGRQCGIDSVCPPETGDLFPWDARAAWGDKIIIGGICPPDLVMRSLEDNLRTACTIMKNMPTTQGFILSTGDATPYGTPMNNLRAITDLVCDLGPASLTGDFDEVSVVEKISKKFL